MHATTNGKPLWKILAAFLAVLMTASLCFAASAEGEWTCPDCGRTGNTGNYCGSCGHPAPGPDDEAAGDGAAEAPEGLMDHAAYAAAELDTEVYIETYVQATQSWWDGKITIYGESPDGAYFIYEAPCSEEDAAKLVPGTKIRVKGFKAEWAGEVEITDAGIEILEGETWIAEPVDVTAILGTDELIAHMNELVTVRGMIVAAQDDGAPFAYKNAVDKTDDLYLRLTLDGKEYDFCVEFYLCGKDTPVYQAAESLQVGDVIDVEGFLYWYGGPNMHLTGVYPVK